MTSNVRESSILQVDDELGRGKFSSEEWQRRQDSLARNNALLFYQEAKAKRLKKIKSKAYHRHLKKKSAAAADAAAAVALDDPETLLVGSFFFFLCRCVASCVVFSACYLHANPEPLLRDCSSLVRTRRKLPLDKLNAMPALAVRP